MGIGARDHIDRMLVKKYSKEKVNNNDVKPIEADDYWKIMREVGEVERTLMKVANYITHKKVEQKEQIAQKAQATS